MFQDESGFSLLPPVRATWAPRGHTPVLAHRFNWKRLSMSGALAYQPDGSQAALTFQIKEGSYNTESLTGFLEDLREHFAGGKITLIRDNLPVHKSRAMTAWIATQRRWLRAERLPGYAHDLNPVEMGLLQCELRRSPVPWLPGSLSFEASMGVPSSVQRRRLW